MITKEQERLETEFFRSLNRVVEALVQAGFGSPVLWPVGAIVIETRGRKTGRKFNVPLMAARIGDLILVSTVRHRSQWVKNLAANPEVRYWLGGREREATASVFAPHVKRPRMEDLSPVVSCLSQYLITHSNLSGVSFAILTPRK